MNEWQEEEDARSEQQSQAQISNRELIEEPDDSFFRQAPGVGQFKPRPASDLFDVAGEDEAKEAPVQAPVAKHGDAAEPGSDWQDIDHADAKADRDWAARKKQLGFNREAPGGFRSAVKKGVGAIGNAVTRIGAAGAQDSYTAGKVLGGVGGFAKGLVDTTKDLSKIGQGVDKIAGLKGENSILEQDIPYLGFNMNTIAKAELAPGIKVADTAKAALQDGGTLLEVAGRGITAASGREALDFGDDERRQYMDRYDAFQAKKDEMRSRLAQGQRTQRGQLTGTTQAAVRQRMAAMKLGKAVNEYGIRPEYEYSMNETADINNMTVQRTAQPREAPNPSFDPGNPDSQQNMQVKPGEVTFERNAGTDPLNSAPDYQTKEELAAGTSAKRWAAPGEALEGLGRIVDGSEHGQEAVRKGEYLKGATQAALSGARTVGKGMATAAATPLGLGLATSALVDVGTVAAGGLLQGVGAGINAATGVGEKADKQRALELRNKHYFGKEHFLNEANGAGGVAEEAPAEELKEEPKQEAEAPEPEQKDAVPNDPFFDSARARRIAERGLRTRDQLKDGDYEKGDRDAGLPEIDHGGAFKNFWHNRMKRPLKKVGQGFLKPVSLVAKLGGYLTGAIPLYNYFQNKKRKRAIEAATNRVNNRRGGLLNEGGEALLSGADEKVAGLEAEDKAPQSDIARAELRDVLEKQNKGYESSKVSRAAGAALKMGGRDLTKENIRAWMQHEKAATRERVYLDWLASGGAESGSEEAKVAADESPSEEVIQEAEAPRGDRGSMMIEEEVGGSLDGFGSDSEGDVGSLDGEGSSRGSGEVQGDPLSAAQEVLRNRPMPGRHLDVLARRARNSGPLTAITEADNEGPDDQDVVRDAETSEMKDAAASLGPGEEEIKQSEAPQSSAAAEWFKKVPGLGPIQNDAPQEEKVPLGFTPEGWAEEKRAWEKLRKK